MSERDVHPSESQLRMVVRPTYRSRPLLADRTVQLSAAVGWAEESERLMIMNISTRKKQTSETMRRVRSDFSQRGTDTIVSEVEER